MQSYIVHDRGSDEDGWDDRYTCRTIVLYYVSKVKCCCILLYRNLMHVYICMCKSGVCSHYVWLLDTWLLSLINRLLNVCALPHKCTFHFRSGYSNSYCMYYQTNLLKTTIINRNDTEK